MAYTGSYKRGDISPTASQSKGWEVTWKVYFFVLIVITVLLATHVPEIFVDLNAQVIGWTAATLLITVGMFGFAWRERIIAQVFWKGYFVIAVLFTIALFFIPITPGVKEAVAKNLTHTIAALSVYGAFMLPALAAIFLYGFRSKEIWAIASKPDAKAKK